MELLLIAIYTALCWAIFKIFKIPVNKWSIPTAILGGVVMIGTMLLLMNYNHPYSVLAREYVVTTPIVPNVSGIVVEVPVKPNTPLKQGDVLFRLDPTLYQAQYDAAKARLDQESQGVSQYLARVEAAKAKVAEAQADRDRAKQVSDRYQEGSKKPNSPFTAVEVENKLQLYKAADATLDASRAQLRDAEVQLVNQAGAKVAQLQAEVAQAKFNLDSTVVRAPTDGMVTQLLLRPGMMAASLPLRPVAVFVHADENVLVAAFWQNSLQRIKVGDEAEVIYSAVPGKVFKGRVAQVQPVLAQGQLSASGGLLSVEQVPNMGRVPVVIELDEDLRDYQLPAGVIGKAAIYTEHAHHVAVMRKILLRMVSWQNYVFGELH
ncbi:MAG: HlyD family secretion protein [Gammaproteobacteria bacterium]|nr:HlyD family secretion protein [Gammaproteobacteria bacterium]